MCLCLYPPSLILNKISCPYRDNSLDILIRVLNGDLPRLLRTKEPADPPSALQLCEKLETTNLGPTTQIISKPIQEKALVEDARRQPPTKLWQPAKTATKTIGPKATT